MNISRLYHPLILALVTPIYFFVLLYMSENSRSSRFHSKKNCQNQKPTDIQLMPFTCEQWINALLTSWFALGGGYVYYLLSSNQTLLIEQMNKLQSLRWTDDLTRAVFVELSLYNPHVNLFTMVVLVFEFTPLGNAKVQPHLWTMKLYRSVNDFENTSVVRYYQVNIVYTIQ